MRIHFKAKVKCYVSRASFKNKFEICSTKICFISMFKGTVYRYF
jgi:hypothetical protein